MAYFRCGQGNGGGTGAFIISITTESSSLYGEPITISKNGSIVGTTVFDSQGEAEYQVSEAGTYTVSVTVGGSTFSNTVTIVDTFDVTIDAIPDGSTATPTDNIQTWLHCAEIFDKPYTTIAGVLADSTTFNALVQSDNAVDYMVRSTTWAADVCADSSAMTIIGADNYCADTLLADSTWLNAICNSTYFESVLNTKVPTMTSNTTPSGQCSASRYYSTSEAYKAFDGNDSTGWDNAPSQSSGAHDWIAYEFTSLVKVCCVKILVATPIERMDNLQLEDSSGNAITSINATQATLTSNVFINTVKRQLYRIGFDTVTATGGVNIATLQFYCREDV